MDCEWMGPRDPDLSEAAAEAAADAAGQRPSRDSLMNETIRQLFARKSVRAFEPTPVAAPVRALLLEAGTQAPTAGNQMLYTILDITDPALKDELAELCDHQPFIAKAPLVLVFLADGRRWLGLYRAAGCDPRPQGPGDALLAMADAWAAAQNVVVAAQSLGLGSCYIGDILENCERVRAVLHLPDDVIPAAMLVIGWPTAEQQARRKPERFDWKAVVQENVYQDPSEAALREMYDERVERSQRARLTARTDLETNGQPSGQQPDDGCNRFAAHLQAFCARKYESDFAHEMNRSAAVYLRTFLQGWD